MASNENRLIADHQQVVATLRNYSNIILINTSGEPVDEYDIEYRIKGYTVGVEGRISIGTNHRIKITIPFGYPHFPPTIKPLSHIFHPEIDENVVPIANYWEENKSLPDLILHIGNMICGQVYNLDAAFNLKAAEYFRKHQSNLPLDSLKRIEKKKEKAKNKQPLRLDFLKPILAFLLLAAFVAVAATGGYFFYERWKVERSRELLVEAQTLLQANDFKRAQTMAHRAQEHGGRLFLLHSAGERLEEDIEKFLNSEELQEGLAGKIRYGDSYVSLERAQKLEFVGDLITEARSMAARGAKTEAVATYEEALAYATEHGLDRKRKEILKEFAGLKLEMLAAASEKAHAEKNWDWAVEKHAEVIDFIEQYGEYIEGEEKLEAATRYLLLIDTIALYSQLAAEAESRQDLATALEYTNNLIELIAKASPKENSTLHTTLVDSIQKAAVLTEKIHIERQRQWLLDNYKEIFQAHYPAIVPETLRSPQALFVKYDGDDMVFDLSCLEKGSGSVVRLRLFYQYDPQSQQWDVYRGTIEDKS